MDMCELLNLSVRRLANRIGISLDNATILLIKNNWDEDSIVEKWNERDSELVNRSGIVITSQFLSREASCVVCNTYTICKTYGCSHFVCAPCVKGHVEAKVMQRELCFECPDFTCGKWMSSSRCLVEVSQHYKERFEKALIDRFTLSVKDVKEGFVSLAVSNMKFLLKSIWISRIAKLLLLYVICKLVKSNSTLTTAVISSVVTIGVIFILMCICICRLLRFVARRFN